MKKFLKSTRFWQVISVILFIAVIGSGGNNNAQELTDLKENLEIIPLLLGFGVRKNE